jgi:lysophospholipase L1-like esterase
MGDSRMQLPDVQVGVNGATTWGRGGSLPTYVSLWSDQRAANWCNSGISGNTLAMALARLADDVLLYQPDAVVWNYGANDASDPHNVTLADFQDQYKEAWAAVEAAGARNYVLTPAVQTGGPNTLLKSYRDWLLDYCPDHGIPVLDLWERERTPGVLTQRTELEGDGIHLGERGKRDEAEFIANWLAPQLPQYAPPLVTREDDPSTLLVGGLFTGTPDANGLPDPWVFWGIGAPRTGATVEAVDDPRVDGKLLRVTYSGGDPDFATIVAQDIHPTDGIGFEDNDILRLCVKLGTDGLQTQMRVYFNGANGGAGLQDIPINITKPMPLRTYEFDVKVYPGTTFITLNLDNYGGDGVHEWAQPTVRNLTRDGLAGDSARFYR